MSPRTSATPGGDDAYRLLAEAMERLVEQRLTLQDEKIAHMNENLNELKQDVKDIREKDIPELQNALVRNQQAGLKRIIAVQATILTMILGTVITLAIKIIFHL